MTLRTRLSLFFVAIVVVPLTGVALAVAVVVPKELDERADERLRGAASAVAAVRAERLDRAGREVARVARALTTVPPASRPAALESARNSAGLDFLVLDGTGSMRDPAFTDGATVDPSSDAARVLRATATLPGGAVLAGGWFTDQAYVQELTVATGVTIAIVADGVTVAGPRVMRGRVLSLPIDGTSRRLVLATQRSSSPAALTVAIGGVSALGVAIACALGLLLSRALARPITRLSEHANAIAAGEYARRAPESGRDEVAALGHAFNAMSDSVQAYVEELKGSRDELRHTLERLGATLRSTRGMEEMLGAVLEAAAATLGADSGALFRVDSDGTLQVEASFGLDAPQATREAAAAAIATRTPVLRPAFDGDDPLGRTVAAAPLSRGTDVVGALAIASAATPEPFGDHDLATLSSFAAQASVAIDNVFLREEAERLAMTDSLTGVPNRRALEIILQREVERAQRYGRPVSVLMIDVDHFKAINDRFGHLEGDRVLVEVARRVAAAVRAGVDVIARYGGEEFVLVLPETDPAGAMRVAAKVVEAISAEPFAVAGGARVTVSVGVASVPGDGPTASDALHAADLALYRAKQEGRNRLMPTHSVQEAVEGAVVPGEEIR